MEDIYKLIDDINLQKLENLDSCKRSIKFK